MNVEVVIRVPAILLTSISTREVPHRFIYRPLAMVYRVSDEFQMYYLNLRYTDMFRGTI